LHAGVRFASAALACVAVLAVGAVVVSGGSTDDPRTPPAIPGLPPPFLGTAVSGNGGLSAAVDAYGDVVDLRAGPAGEALIDNPSDRQAAGTVPADTGIVPMVRIGDGPPLPMWRAETVTQQYSPGTNVVRTVTRFGGEDPTRVAMTTAASDGVLAVVVRVRAATTSSAGAVDRATPTVTIDTTGGVHCERGRRTGELDLLCSVGAGVLPDPGPSRNVARASADVIRAAIVDGRHWLASSLPLGVGAPEWATAMYRRSLLTIHALTSKRTGAVAAGARDGWAYVWPRDAATAALALAASGHRAEARHVARFLTGLDLAAAARFDESGAPVPGRAAQGDATGWVAAAARAAGVPGPRHELPWRNRADYQESSPGTYLGNALAAAGARVDRPKSADIERFSAHQPGGFEMRRGLVREAGDPGSGLDSAAAWAVRPFGLTPLYPAAERTLLRLAAHGTRYGITPGEGWEGGEDPWTAPTAWSAWALAALGREARRSDAPTSGSGGRGPRTNLPLREGEDPSRPPRSSTETDRRAALALLVDLRRASTPAGDLPERVGAHTGIPTSTTPLLWSSAFAVLALRELWP
jgi:glucoamylase